MTNAFDINILYFRRKERKKIIPGVCTGDNNTLNLV